MNKKPNKLMSVIKEYWKLILVLVLTPVILGAFMMLPFLNLDNGSNDGWLGFWGGYLASIITICGVYWQVKKQAEEARKNLAMTLANERVQEAKKARPIFIVEILEMSLWDKDYYLNNTSGSQPDEFVKWAKDKDTRFAVIQIQNIGKEAIANSRVKFIYPRGGGENESEQECIIVKKILPGEKYLYVPKRTETDNLDARNIETIHMWFNTSSGEEVQYEMKNNYNNGLFNTMAVVSKLDLPDASNFEDYPSGKVFDSVGKSEDYQD